MNILFFVLAFFQFHGPASGGGFSVIQTQPGPTLAAPQGPKFHEVVPRPVPEHTLKPATERVPHPRPLQVDQWNQSGATPSAPSTYNPKLVENIERLSRTPLMAVAMALATHEGFLENFEKLVTSPKKQQLLSAEIALIIIFFLFRVWQAGQDQGLLKRLIMTLILGVLYLVSAGWVVPNMVLGEPFHKTAMILIKTVPAEWGRANAETQPSESPAPTSNP